MKLIVFIVWAIVTVVLAIITYKTKDNSDSELIGLFSGLTILSILITAAISIELVL